ncbi:MAG: CoA-binding protein [bacterium]|nr:CoA-binding protein [bacterium]
MYSCSKIKCPTHKFSNGFVYVRLYTCAQPFKRTFHFDSAIAVTGASKKPDRYSYRAIEQLVSAGHRVFPVHPVISLVQGIRVFGKVEDIKADIHTVSLYISQEKSEKISDAILDIKPGRIIFNPGAENSTLKAGADKLGIITIEGCTLVLLRTGQF